MFHNAITVQRAQSFFLDRTKFVKKCHHILDLQPKLLWVFCFRAGTNIAPWTDVFHIVRIIQLRFSTGQVKKAEQVLTDQFQLLLSVSDLQ